MSDKVVTRFPPSPTGFLQAGNVRTAVFNYLFAKKHEGTFILRIEDTDKSRSKKEFEDDIVKTVEWLGLSYDDFYRQSERGERHRAVLKEFIEKDLAYVSQEVPTEEGQRSEVIRFRNPNTMVTFTDVIRGEISFDTTELGDFIIARSLDEPLYHLGVVVDDVDSGITHVIRGEDHISNTPRQILIQRALGTAVPPTYAHLPLVLAPDRSKLSKRTGAKAVSLYKEEGYLPEAMVNYLALLGWHPEGEQEIFTIDELVQVFDLERIQKGSGIFDETKLKWFNHEHIKRLSREAYELHLRQFIESHGEHAPAYLFDIASELQMRSQTLGEAAEALRMGEFNFMETTITLNPLLLVQGAKTDADAIKKNFSTVVELLAKMPASAFTAEAVKEVVFPYATEVGRAGVLWPMRVALSGMEKSPDPFTLAALLGKEKTLERIEKAAQML